MRGTRGLRRVSQAAPRADDALREQRLEAIKAAIERFTFGLGLMIAGRDSDLAGVASATLLSRLCSALLPFVEAGGLMRPDFGAYAELRVDGDLLDPAKPVAALLEFEDRSMHALGDGRLIPSPRRRVRLTMRLSLEPCLVEDCAFELLG